MRIDLTGSLGFPGTIAVEIPAGDVRPGSPMESAAVQADQTFTRILQRIFCFKRGLPGRALRLALGNV